MVKSILHRGWNDRAQVIKDRFPRRKVNAIPALFQIPTELTWRQSMDANKQTNMDVTEPFHTKNVDITNPSTEITGIFHKEVVIS